MVMKGKKGQAALEFLTTYGWAFLVILVMIGALAYFGVLDPSRFTPQRCQIGIPLVCNGENYKLSNTTASFQLKNSLNTPFAIGTIQVKDDSGAWTNCASQSVSPNPVPVDGVTDITCNYPASGFTVPSAGQKLRVQIQVPYSTGSSYDPTYGKVVPGEIYANVV